MTDLMTDENTAPRKTFDEISARPEAPGTAGPIDGGYAARLELS